MKTGPQLVLEHMTVYQLISSPEFWQRVPELRDLQEAGQEAHRLAVDVALGKVVVGDCGGCGTLRTALRPFLERFQRRLASLYAENPTHLGSFIAYVSEKRGYRPKEIIIIYRDAEGVTQRLAF